jgi:hypothetical protein
LSAQTNGRTAALNMLRYFMNAYTCAFGNSEYDVLARIAMVHLNRKLKKRVTVSHLFDSTVGMLGLY